jgi:phosphatidylethanolamine/phosphatidyl-N-methylethanolamine N-methyltransferase
MKAATEPSFSGSSAGAMSVLLFVLETVRSPRDMGAICPSSDTLAQHVARQLPQYSAGKVIELGAGTGAITRALLRQGVVPQDLVAVERSAAMAKRLRRRYPQITVVEGDAADLAQLLGPQRPQVRAVVSGLPLRSLPPATVRAIMANLDDTLAPGGTFIQFTYSLRAPLAALPMHFRKLASRIVWRNIPPARVDVYLKSV